MCRRPENKVTKINGYSRLHRIRTPVPLLKIGSKNAENDPFSLFLRCWVAPESILTALFCKTCAIMPRMASIWLGTSGFSYKEWRPIFYPEGLSEKEFLKYYSGKLNSVEIDYTFYRMPSAKTIEAWKGSTPDNFKFTLKASQQITHRQRLKVPSD